MAKKDEVAFPATWLYHAEKAPEGQMFEDADAHDAALADGWVDTPAKFGEKAEKPAGKGKK